MTDKRKDIITALQSTNDEQLIEDIYQILNLEKSIEEIDMHSLPQHLQQKLETAIADYHDGRYISNNEMKQKVQKWLMK